MQPAAAPTDRIDEARLGPLVGCFRDQAAFDDFVYRQGGLVAARWLTEQSFRYSGVHGSIPGWSELIGGPTYYAFEIAPGTDPVDLRDQLVCAHTGLAARLRFGASLALRLIDDAERADVYLTEQCTLAYRWLRQRIRGLRGSEYFDDDQAPKLLDALTQLGCDGDELRFEDVTALSWPSASFDGVLSFEVLEHVPAHRAALAEFQRVLRPGGYLILTAPFMQDAADNLLRARMDRDGSVEHLTEPEYHGDPVRATGVLCFHTFGWQLLDDARGVGFRDAAMLLPWDYTQGLMGPLWTLVARK